MHLLTRLTLFFLASSLTNSAFAHVGHDVRRAERYLKVELEDTQLRVVVTMTLGTSAMLGALQRADEDADGSVSRSESESYLAAWTESLADALPVYLDGTRLPLTWESPYMAPIGPVMPIEGAVEAVAYVPLEPTLWPQDHVLVVEDRMTVPEFERTDVRFVDASETSELTRGGLTEGVDAEPRVLLEGDTLDLSFGPDAPATFVSAHLETPLNRWVPIGAGAVFALLVSAALLRRRKTSATKTLSDGR